MHDLDIKMRIGFINERVLGQVCPSIVQLRTSADICCQIILCCGCSICSASCVHLEAVFSSKQPNECSDTFGLAWALVVSGFHILRCCMHWITSTMHFQGQGFMTFLSA